MLAHAPATPDATVGFPPSPPTRESLPSTRFAELLAESSSDRRRLDTGKPRLKQADIDSLFANGDKSP